MESYIQLENIELFAYHGVMLQERVVGNTFKIDVKIKVDVSYAAENDDLADTVNYAEVYELIKKEMAIPSKLIEHVAKRIINSIKTTYPQVEQVEIKLSKRNPPIEGQVDYASVILID
ncbi:dihydroneopterin aldolase [Dysgonomonas sp. 25]|uniref:dihydroneopterin aldolase n=1 Tax=Dysgonomonas sp. 25 TaxID=2302933 RepID=UPI0013D3CC36|nr:dihydroneopterin aldolase [Dysgonomonas sp. 25]NDV68081.1 dihydroneopterin aldolase [Dysgonomonas sp. 25]